MTLLHCQGFTYIKDAHYSVFEIPKFIFVVYNIHSISKTKKTKNINRCTTNLQHRIYVKCDLTQICLTYNLFRFIVVTKDDQTLLIDATSNDEYSVYHADTKSYEPLKGYRFDYFIMASGTNIVLCYTTNDIAEHNPKIDNIILDMDDWILKSNINSDILAETFNKYSYHLTEPLKIGPYVLNSYDIGNLIELSYELNDQLLNAHLHITTTLSAVLSFLIPYSSSINAAVDSKHTLNWHITHGFKIML